MSFAQPPVYVGAAPFQREVQLPAGQYVQLLGETYYRIAHYDQMPPFFISLVSSADHWLFIGSSGGLTAGRVNAESALFPYETEDKVMAHHELTGSKQLIRLTRADQTFLWEPFSTRYAGLYRLERHLYKNIIGNKLVFEEINHDLGLTLRLAWRLSDRFGFVKSSWLHNHQGGRAEIELLDGLQNLLPYGVRSDTQQALSSLLDAYKRSELEQASGLGIFALSATLSDQPEPSESLQATIAWQCGLDVAQYLLSTTQLDAFRAGEALQPEVDVCGRAGAYFVIGQFELAAEGEQSWHIVADVNQDAARIVQLSRWLQQYEATIISAELETDIEANTRDLAGLVALADGWQKSASLTSSTHHYANVLFNIMRGGVLATGYQVDRADLLAFFRVRNRRLLADQSAWFETLPAQIDIGELYGMAAKTGNVDLIRLSYEYLPLSFSRRHGDPSRPWNQFSINLKNADGSPRLDYQGNWRDIFQNWEPLLLAFPAYAPGIIAKFLNATTADGYNPYRVTRAGIEWEVPEQDNPWSNIGYWSDHQIIYLQKLLEIANQLDPEMLQALYAQPVFSYADVPYRLKAYEAMLDNWSQTIEFDWRAEQAIQERVAALGTDGRLLPDETGQIIHVTMTEKLLSLLLAKLANLVPEGGIWMNTQRPEWNDANNALVGKGLSVVTTAYLRRFVLFWQVQLAGAERSFVISAAVGALLAQMTAIMGAHRPDLKRGFDDGTRRAFLDAMGQAATAYRHALYTEGLAGQRTELAAASLGEFLELTLVYLDQTLRANQRPDGLYHAYNTLVVAPGQAKVANLYLMLEGQVAILSSGLLTPAEALTMLQKLKHSELFRADQHSYMLYPQRRLPGFLEKNNVPAGRLANLALVQELLEAGDRRLMNQDEKGVYHFNGHFHNVHDVRELLDQLAEEPGYQAQVMAERETIEALFEEVFNHQAFTGRSGTFFAYEGLGSIYWHMVAKLLLAVQEIYQQAVRTEAAPELVAALAAVYYDVRQGIGYMKGPAEYGAFPTDPYSHTPAGGGARQPGMTGQVKEEILTRWGELGVSVQAGVIQFAPSLLQSEEYLPAADSFTYLDVNGQWETIKLPARSLAFTYCQVPIIYTVGEQTCLEVMLANGSRQTVQGNRLDKATSQHILARDGHVRSIHLLLSGV